MNIRVFATNNLGKIEFDRTSLEKVLNEIYEEGYRAGEKHAKDSYWTWCPTITSSTTNATTPSITYLNNCTTAADPTHATTDVTADAPEVKTPTTNTSFSINGEKVDFSALSTLSESFAEANDAFNRAVNSISRSTRYNHPNTENILAKEIRGL